MALIRDLIVQGVQMLLVVLLAPLVTGLIRKMKARLLRRRVRRCFSPIVICSSWSARRRCWPKTPPGCSAPRPI